MTFSILNRYLDGSPLPPDWQVFPMASSKNIFDSSVRLARVEPKHSGQYECQPSPLQSAVINLHVVKGNIKYLEITFYFFYKYILKKKNMLKRFKKLVIFCHKRKMKSMFCSV